MSTQTTSTSSAGSTSTGSVEGHEGFTAAERAAIKQRAAETRQARRRTSAAEKAATAAQAVLDRIEEMTPEDRDLARAVHRLITEAAPQLAPKLWYGMPAYALDGKIVCHFQDAAKFSTRYATLGFSDRAALDDGAMWPTSFALTEITDELTADITALVRRAVA